MTLPFDHRSSVARYLDKQADKYESRQRRSEATLLRAMSSNVRAALDVDSGEKEISTPVHAIAIAVAGRLGSCTWQELFEPTKCRTVVRVRDAAIWVVRQRFGYSYECIGAYFNRDGSSVRDALKRAEEMRLEGGEHFDLAVKNATEEFAAAQIRCQHCTESLLLA